MVNSCWILMGFIDFSVFIALVFFDGLQEPVCTYRISLSITVEVKPLEYYVFNSLDGLLRRYWD